MQWGPRPSTVGETHGATLESVGWGNEESIKTHRSSAHDIRPFHHDLRTERDPLKMTSSSLGSNPPNATRNITAGGSDWLWVVFAIMLVSDAGMIFWSFLVRHAPSKISTTVQGSHHVLRPIVAAL